MALNINIDASSKQNSEYVNQVDPTKVTQGFVSIANVINTGNATYWYHSQNINVSEGQIIGLYKGGTGKQTRVLFRTVVCLNSLGAVIGSIENNFNYTVPSGGENIIICFSKDQVSEAEKQGLQVVYNKQKVRFDSYKRVVPFADVSNQTKNALNGYTMLNFSDSLLDSTQENGLATNDTISAIAVIAKLTGLDIKNMGIGGANISLPCTRNEITTPYDWRYDVPNSASFISSGTDALGDRHLEAQVLHAPNTMRWKYDLIQAKYLQSNGNYVFKPDIVHIAVGHNDWKVATSYDTYDEVKDLDTTALNAIRANVVGGSISANDRQVNCFLRLIFDKLLTSEILETRDGYTYGIDCRYSKIMFSTPIQSASNEVLAGFSLQDFGDLITDVINDYSINKIDGARDSGICKRFEVNGGNGRYLIDGIHPNTDGDLQFGTHIASRIVTYFLK